MHQPVYMRWTGDGFEPATARQTSECDKRFVVGEVYPLDEAHQRSGETHRHEFAFIREAWQNLPEHYADAPFARSPEHLRKFALIMTGWCDTTTFVASSKAEAQRMASFIRPLDEFSVVSVKEATVTRAVAKSQSMKAMGKRDFQASKQAILDYLEDMIGVQRGALAKHGEAA